jgi:hypothetical protein
MQQSNQAPPTSTPPLPPQNQSEPVSGASSASTINDDAPTHFDDLIDAAEPAASPTAAMVGKEDFHKLFVFGFTAGHEFTKLQSLKIGAENEAARNCAHALYDTILDVPALHFMLQPQGKWFERIFAIGVFTVPLAASVRAELRARRAPKGIPTTRAAAPANFSAAKKATAAAVIASDGDPDEDARMALTGGQG